ncbi:hypothetical protein Fcan01_28355 [Folsomia candida]|uniref:DUF4806 domain-containing protein n=1 Tax=Folsomia candida TaxID=158441 RepID=A0A226CWJ4_FOLCA|nr:hypothetical protein Fcan01_28355 [Folsomia candida]
MSSEIKKYSVVNFHDENTVAAVCSSWLNEDKSICSWPIGPNAGDKLRKNLPADLDAPKFPCQWLMSYNSLKSASKGCIAAKSTDKIPPSEFEETTHKKQRNTRKGQSAAKSTPSTKYSESTSSDESSLSSEECETLPVTSFIPTTPSISLSTNSQVQPLSALPQSHNSSQAEENLFDQSGNNETTFSYIEITNPETVAELVTLVRDLKTESQSKLTGSGGEGLDHPKLPVCNKEDFYKLSDWLKRDQSNIEELSIQLGYVGGRDLDDIIARLLSGLISTELAQTCSHSGKGKKSEFGLVGVFLDLVYKHRNGVGSRIRTEFEATMTIRISISNSFRVRAYAGDSNSDFEFVPGTTRATNPECVPNLGDDFRTNSYRMRRHIGI